MALDLDAIQAEAENDPGFKGFPPFEFTFDGELYTVNDSVANLKVLVRITGDDVAGALKAMLGARQYARLDESPKPFTPPQMGALVEAWQKHYGLDVDAGKPEG